MIIIIIIVALCFTYHRRLLWTSDRSDPDLSVCKIPPKPLAQCARALAPETYNQLSLCYVLVPHHPIILPLFMTSSVVDTIHTTL
jgi:hypothetical protein